MYFSDQSDRVCFCYFHCHVDVKLEDPIMCHIFRFIGLITQSFSGWFVVGLFSTLQIRFKQL